jgi:hypothetical protein
MQSVSSQSSNDANTGKLTALLVFLALVPRESSADRILNYHRATFSYSPVKEIMATGKSEYLVNHPL